METAVITVERALHKFVEPDFEAIFAIDISETFSRARNIQNSLRAELFIAKSLFPSLQKISDDSVTVICHKAPGLGY
jgi:hypothetical protein